MATARTKTFRSGNSEAVRLPKEVAFGQADLELTVERNGDVITIYPTRRSVAEMSRLLLEMPGPGYVQEREPFEAPDRPGLHD